MNRLKAMQLGASSSVPMIVGGIPFGLLFGSLATSYGLDLWFTVALSSVVFAGSAQFVALGLIYAGSPVWVLVSTTLIVNLRHLLYAADFVKYVKHLPMSWRVVLGFGLIDETYAAVKPHYASGKADEQHGHWVYLGSFLSFYLMWNLTTLTGAVAGELIPGMSEWGLEFAMVATFIGIISPYLKSRPYWFAFVAASSVAILLNGLPNNLGLLIAALVGVVAGVVGEKSHKQLAHEQEA